MRRHLPNFLTCCNLLSGCLGIVFTLEDRGVPAAYFVWGAAIFDFMDGLSARLLKLSSPIGKELDSLADVISFGLLPSIFMYKLLGVTSPNAFLPFVAFSIAICSSVRLAIFNVDEMQRDSFKGLNTPANSIFITALPFVGGNAAEWLALPWVLVTITLVFSWLLVSRIRIFAFKFKNLSWSDNKVRFIFMAVALGMLIFWGKGALPLIILTYIAFSFIDNLLKPAD
jgi:CDP-diacylglycerol--serine O-phosphatidyltransferase